MTRRSISLLLLAAALFVPRFWAVADEPAPAAPQFLDERVRGPVMAAQIVAAGNGPLAAAYLRTGLQQGLWLAKPCRDPRIDKGLLSGIEHRKKVQDAKDNKFEALSYNILVLHAKEVSPKDLAAIARKEVFYVNLWEDPQRYVGEPIHITGRMKRLIRMEAPRSLWNDGIKTLYEGWLFPDDKDGDNPYCLVFSELPKNVKTGEKVDYQVSCDAYFFKLYRYDARERNNSGRPVRRDAPLFIGRSFVRKAVNNDAAEESSWSISAVTPYLFPSCLTVLILLVGFVVGINWWFKRGDEAVQKRIAATRGNAFIPPPPDNGDADLPIEGPRTSRFSDD